MSVVDDDPAYDPWNDEPPDWDGADCLDAPDVLDIELDPDAVAKWAATAPVGEGIWTPFGPFDVPRLSQDGRIDVLLALEQLKRWADGQQAQVLAQAVADPEPMFPRAKPCPDRDRQFVAEEIACALRWSVGMTMDRLVTATALVGTLPAALEQLENGRFDYRIADALAGAVVELDQDTTSKIEARVLPRAPEQTTAEFRRSLRRAVLRFDPRRQEEKHAAEVKDRRVCLNPANDGMSWLSAHLPAADAQTVWTATQAVADLIKAAQRRSDQSTTDQGTMDAGSTDQHTADQHRADALVAICAAVLNGTPITGLGRPAHCAGGGRADASGAEGTTGGGEGGAGSDVGAMAGNAAGSARWCAVADADSNELAERIANLPRWQGRRPNIQVSVALSTLLGVDDQPAELDGYGPITADAARRIAADPSGTWRRLLTDKKGVLVDYGRTVYRPPADLRDFVIARDRTSRLPGDHRDARRCELDHVDDFAKGGETNAENLVPAGSRPHHLKHDGGWEVERHDNGDVEWTTPLGRHYTKPAETYPIDQTNDGLENQDPPF